MGHLFVAQGDLTKLACDAVIIPCDSYLNVNRAWESVLPPNLPEGHGDWLRLPGVADAHGVVKLPGNDGRRICAVVAVELSSEPFDVVDRVWNAIAAVAPDLRAADGRALPLVGISLVGTGDGGLRGRRGEVIDKLLARHRATPIAADVALILRHRRDFAAVQDRRVDNDWSDLDEPLIAKADRLGTLAASGQLSLFLGAGVSQPVGLPTWWRLLEHLAKSAGIPLPEHESPYDAATPIVEELGDRYPGELVKRLGVSRHAVGHSLLACLPVKQMVTTNFDPCMELALNPVLNGEFRVLPRELTEGRMSWLLKLHGDVHNPQSIVLTRKDATRHEAESEALRGVVQSLLLTSHLLFVGFSFTDDVFLKLAAAVTRVREEAAGSSGAGRGTGTAIALTPKVVNAARYREIEMFSMLDDDDQVPEAARRLEIFLDRLSWKAASEGDLAAEYLLDDNYETALSPEDKDLRRLLQELEATRTGARSARGWKRMERALRDLGGGPRQQ